MVEKINALNVADRSAKDLHGVAASRFSGKYLTFKLADEEYGIGILKVREIIGLLEITMVPRMPAFVRGVINLRGKVIPVIDLRLKFGMPLTDDTKLTCIIVVDLKRGDVSTLVGILVDTVSEVVNIAETDIDKTPNFGAKVNTSFIMGVAKIKGGVKILLDIDQVLGIEEFHAVVASK
ncbi:MAG: purine-binding chemotaxis protein CheW [Candidatus Riflebacteria bacterium]|nr:purine-binding chemotaxis protein CheW [Candidatus Riflebacteria bacterium]